MVTDRVLLESGTGAGAVKPPRALDQTLPAVARLTEVAGGLRSGVRFFDEHAVDLHNIVRKQDWVERTNLRARSAPKALLDELADLGFAWSDVAKMVGVSVPALQKWRRGEKASGENRQRIAAMLAACELIAEHYLIAEIASWFETPVRLGTPVTPIALWSEGHADLVFEYAGGHENVDRILDRWDSGWRERYRSEFEAFEAGDGSLSLRMRTS